jgi:release factor glutamine methyltransferase
MPEVRDYEPPIALDGGRDGLLYYRKILSQCGEYLHPSGRVYFEIGYDQGQDVSDLMREVGFESVKIRKDYAGCDRVVTGILP